ncbi:MAG: Dabb family protein [Bacteroidota bacterium]
MRQLICLLFFLTLFTMTAFAQSENDYVRHVVVFKYKADASEADIQKVTDSFRDLQNQIPGIVSFEHGINNSPEGLNKGFTHVYLLTFEDAEARDTYLPHPNHKEFGNLLSELGVLEEVFVVDYMVGG